MKVAEAVEHMTQFYLHRVIDSFTKDFPKPEVQKAREIILKNSEELTQAERISVVLQIEGPYEKGLLHSYILEAMINRPGYTATEKQIVEEVQQAQTKLLRDAQDPDCLQYQESSSVEILRAVLEVALENKIITREELNLIERLRQKLGLNERTKCLILAQLNHFPKPGSRIHAPADIHKALIGLQKRGAIFYCNLFEKGMYVMPEEVVDGVKQALGIQINRKGWRKLLHTLGKRQLGQVLDSAGLPRSGRKEQLIERIVGVGLLPSECLSILSTDELYNILKKLPGARVSGTKNERIHRLLEYFDKLVMKSVPESAPPGELYYRYLPELAARDRESLYANDVIKKDRNIDSAFEEGTRYLFQEKLKVKVLEFTGSDHPDGGFEISPGGDLLLWDNKSKEEIYTFPASHIRQFKRYIRDSERRVSCFLVIVPEVDEGASRAAARLKIDSKSDTDVAVLTADDLYWLAQQWLERGQGKPFSPEVFNMTGILDRQSLEKRLTLFI